MTDYVITDEPSFELIHNTTFWFVVVEDLVAETVIITSTLTLPEEPAIVVADGDRFVYEINEEFFHIVAEEQPFIVLTHEGVGPPGPPGPSEGATILVAAGETIHGRRAVRVRNGLVYHPDIFDNSHANEVVGVAMSSGSPGDIILVRVAGTHTDVSWNFLSGAVYCGAGGVLTQNALAGWILPIGRAQNPQTLIIDVDYPTLRN